MTTTLKPKETAACGMMRLICRQIRSAAKHLDDGSEKEQVHELRQNVKKIRALLKLIRYGLARKRYQAANSRFRDIARPLAGVRDAEVVLQTFSQFSPEEYAATDNEAAVIRAALEARFFSVRDRVLNEEDALSSAHHTLRQARQRVSRWKIDKGGWSVIGKGFSRVYRDTRAAWETADAEPSIENIHEWRKLTKHLWSQVKVLKPISPAHLQQFAKQLHDLSDQLGLIRDWSMLRTVIQNDFDDFETVRNNLIRAIDQRSEGMRTTALRSARPIFRQDSDLFLQQMKVWWKNWHR